MDKPSAPAPDPAELQRIMDEAKRAAEAVLRERAGTDPKARAALAGLGSLGKTTDVPDT